MKKFRSSSPRLDVETLEDRILFSAVPVDPVEPVEDTQQEEVPAQVESADATGTDTQQENVDSQIPSSDATTQNDTTQAPRRELLVVDERAETDSEGDSTGLTEDLVSSAPETIELNVLQVNRDEEGLDAVTTKLEEMTRDGTLVDAIHLVSHADEGEFTLGNVEVSRQRLLEDEVLMQQLQSWRSFLTEDADIMLYGCNVAAGEDGRAFMEQLAELTSADVAGSDDLTGQNDSGTANWVLEVDTGPVEATSLSSTLDLVLPPEPASLIDAPGSIRIGETFDVTVAFDNSNASDTGYGPWLDIAFDRTGADGNFDPSNPTTGGTADVTRYDGLQLVSNPTYLGTTLNFTELTLDNSANGGLGVLHPYAVDNTGAPLYLNTTDITGPFVSLLAGLQEGDGVLVVEMPFGSFTPEQPPAEVNLSFSLSNEADLGATHRIASQAGFRYGADPLDNPAAPDPSIIGDAVVQIIDTEATLVTLDKEYLGPENETATGPNFERRYRISVDIADGQTIDNLHLFDELDDTIQYVGIAAASHAYTLIDTPSTDVPGGRVGVEFTSSLVGGTGDEDAWVEIAFYVPRRFEIGGDGDSDEDPADFDTNVLEPDEGDDWPVDNQAYGFFSWVPLDNRDAPQVIGLEVDGAFDNTDVVSALATAAPDADFEHEDLEESPLVIQKNFTTITDAGSTGATPGDLLEFTLDFQVSDYFAVENVVVDDVLSDGLRLDLSFTPVITINGNQYTLSEDFTLGDDWSYTVNSDNNLATPATDGSTDIQFLISQILLNNGRDGKLLGGGVNPADTDVLVDNPLTASGYNDLGTVGTITYRAIIQDEFTDTAPSGERPLNPRDEINNTVDITADVLDLTSGLQTRDSITPYGGIDGTTTDDSAESLRIIEENVRKDIYAINGIQRLVDPTDPNSAEDAAFTSAFRTGGVVSGGVNLQPGDEVTYRLSYTIPTGDVESLRLTDFFPLPVFDVEDPDQSGSGSWTFDNNLDGSGNPDTVANILSSLASGQITYGPSHTLHTVTDPFIPSAPGSNLGDITGDPETSYGGGNDSGIDSVSNSLRIEWGDFSNTNNTEAELDILVTVTVSDDPFADGLFLTNQVQSGERNTQSPGTEQNANAIIQIVLNQPVVDIYKGVVASTQGPGTSAGGLIFDDLGIGDDDFSGTLAGQTNAEAIGLLDLTSGPLPDAGDVVRFALIAQNTGRSDAFDVVVNDTLPESYVNNYDDLGSNDPTAFINDTNFRVFDGAGNELTLNTDYTVTWDAGTSTFTVELTDDTVSDPNEGGLNRGIDTTATGSPDITDGSNAIIVLYDLTLNDDLLSPTAGDLIPDAGSTITNTASLTNYAGSDGGADHTDPDDKTDDASVEVAIPSISKTLIGTEFDLDNNNAGTEAVIGEVVTFQIEIEVPEGETINASLRDRMDPGLSFVEITDVVYAGGVSSTNTIVPGTGPANVTLSDWNGGTNNQAVYDFGAITNSNTDNTSPGTITITYEAVVLNQNTEPSAPGNQAGTELDNVARLSWDWNNDPDSIAGVDGSDNIQDDSPNVQVIEPSLSIDVQASDDNISYVNNLTGLDAGDTVYLRFRVESPSGLPTAFDIDLNGVIPAEIENLIVFDTNVIGTGLSVTDGSGNALTNDDFTISLANVLSLSGGRDFDVGASSGFEVILQGSLAASVAPAATYNTVAQVEWTSIDGTRASQSIHTPDGVERDGTGGVGTDAAVLNNYEVADNTTVVTIPNVDVVKTIVDTSEAHTDVTDVAIGEIVRYRIAVDIPEGTIENFQIEDLLPPGLIYLDDGTAEISYIADDGFTSTDPAGSSLSLALGVDLDSATFVSLPDANVGSNNSLTSDLDSFSRGINIHFKLGDFVNNDRDANVEQVILEFNVLVDNSGASPTNDAGDVLMNRARAQIDGTTLDTSPFANVTVVEPVLTVAKSISTLTPGPYDGANPIRYEVVVTNTTGSNRADAFEVELTDNLPAFLGSASIVSVTPSAGVTGEASSVAGNLITVTADVMEVGSTITVVYEATLSGTVPAGQDVENTAELIWTSLPGTGTVGGTNTTGSSTPGASGDTDGERNGNTTGPNDYNASDSESFPVETPAIFKAFRDGSLSANDTSDINTDGADVRIGESVTYDILVTLPEGTTQDLVVRDILPVGLRVDAIEVITTPGTNAGESDMLTAAWNGVGLTPTIPTLPISGSSNVDVAFGNVSASSDNNTDNNQFVVRVTATAINIVGNQNGDVLANSASYTFTEPGSGTTTEVTEVDSTDTEVTVVEPELEIVKTIETATNNVDGGDSVTYQLVVRHLGSSTADAREVILDDTFPAELEGYTFVSADIQDGTNPAIDVSGSFAFNAGTRVLSTTGDIDLLLDTAGPGNHQELVLTFTATVPIDTTVGTDIDNTASITWSSGNGGLDGDATGTEDERTGSDGEGGSPNDHADSNTASLETIGVLNVTKSADKTEATIGELITYTVEFEVAEGTTIINWTDSLPTGLVLASNVTIDSNPDSLNITGLNATSLTGQTLTVSTTSVSGTTDPSALETSTFTLTYQALVQNVGTNVGLDTPAQTDLINDVVANSDLNDDGDTDDLGEEDNDQTTTTVVEPDLQIVKTITSNTTNLEAGDTITYQLQVSHTAQSTADAFELVLDDTFPTELESYSLISATLSSPNDVIGNFTLSGAGVLTTDTPLDLADGETLTLTVSGVITDATAVDTTISNTAEVRWSNLDSGQDGDDPGISDDTNDERTGNNGSSPNTYVDNDTVDATTVGVLNVDKARDVATATPGDIITYTVTVEVAEGTTTNVVLTDTLPTGTQFVTNSASLTSPNPLPAGWIIDGFDMDSASQTLTQVVVPGTSGTAGDVDTATFSYTYQVRVLDVATNDGVSSAGDGDGQTPLTNDLDASANDLPDDNDNQVTTTVIEPQLVVTKTDDDSDGVVVPGQVLTYTLTVTNSAANGSTATAYDIRVRDDVPAELTNISNITPSVVPVSNTSSGNTIDLVFAELAVGASITITFEAEVVASPSSPIDNTVKIYYDNQPADEFNPSDPNDTDPSPDTQDRDYGADVGDEVFNLDTDPHQDTERILIGPYELGDRVWFDYDGDGVQDGSEAGIEGVDVSLLYFGNDGVFGTADDVNMGTQTTNANGNYLFEDLANGTYRATVSPATLPDGAASVQTFDLDGLGTPDQAFAVIAGADREDVDFGYRGTAEIGDTLYVDANDDGDQDAGEPGLSGVDVTLRWAGVDGALDTADDVLITDATDANGEYGFANLFAGDYRVDVDETDLPAGLDTTPTSGGTGSNISVGADPFVEDLTVGETDLTVDFGYTGTGSIGDTIFHDADNDGVLDAGEYGLAGIDVELIWAGQDGDFSTLADNVIYTGTTDANGNYLFENLAAGNFRVNPDQSDLPAGLTVLTSGADSVGVDPYEMSPTGDAAALGAGEDRLNADFGYTGSGELGDRVWYDVNGDGVQDAGEVGLSGVTVDLIWAGLDGNAATLGDNLTFTTVTDANGNYTFGNLPIDFVGGANTGAYEVVVDISTLPTGFDTQTYDDDGIGVGSEDRSAITLTDAVPSNLDQDFGYRGSSELGNRVYHDANGDGDFDAGFDLPLSSIDLTLTWAGQDGDINTAADNVVILTTTDANGNYLFDDLPAGEFRVDVDDTDLPAGITILTTGAAGVDISVGTDPFTATLGAADSDLTVDFGYRADGSIGDTVFADVDRNGVEDPYDFGIPNIDLTVTWAGLDGDLGTAVDNVVYTATTNASGQYTVGNLAAGTYQVDVDTADLPAGFTEETYDLDGIVTASTTTTTLTIGQDRKDVDFGYTGQGSISDTVWLDLDGNGTQDGLEPGIGGVTLDLVYDINGDGLFDGGDVIIDTTTTDSNGLYIFDELLPENYLVRVTDTGNVLTDASNTFDKDDYAGVNNDGIGATELGPDENDDGVDFGYQGAASISDFVWNDFNSDGVPDGDEPGVAGVDLNLYEDRNNDGLIDAGDVQIDTTTTDADGLYLFEGLIAGNYLVEVDTTATGLAGGTNTFDKDDYAGSNNDDIGAVELGSNENDTAVDFGYVGNAQLGDYVWFDKNGDGVQDATEPPLPGVRVYLDLNENGSFDAGDASVLTDASGAYVFTGLLPRDYDVRVDSSTLPTGSTGTSVFDDADIGGTPSDTGNFSPVQISAGEDEDQVDFGYNGPYVLSGSSYHDRNKDNDLTGADDGLGGITIELIWDTNDDGAVDGGDFILETTSTAADGSYSFADLIAGDYLVREAQPAGYGQGENGSDLIDAAITNADVADLDFGNTTGSIAGTVYEDHDNDGVQDVGETGIAGVDVTLTWSGADGIFGNTDDRNLTIATDSNGDYLFDQSNTDGFVSNGDATRGLLALGSYIITEAQPATYLDGAEALGDASTSAGVIDTGSYAGLSGRGGADEMNNIAIGLGQDAVGYDFGEILPATIEGAVYLDLDNDGVFDGFESGLDGVTVTLTGNNDLGDAVSIITTTDSNGDYLFENLRPSDGDGYTVTETQPTAYLDGIDTLGSGFETATGFTGANDNGTVGSDLFSSIVIGNTAPANNTGSEYNFGELFDANLVKSITGTSEIATDNADVAIGETVTYRITFDVPYGSLSDVQVQDLLPPGMRFVEGTAVAALVSSDGTLLTSSTLAGGIQTDDGTSPAFTLPDASVSTSATSDEDTYASGTDVFFKFGDLTNSEPGSTPGQIVIEFDALVLNEAGVNNGGTLSNTATLYWDTNGDGDSQDPDDEVETSDPEDATVVEPALNIEKTIISNTTALDAGDTLTYRLTISHTGDSTADAFELILNDTLPIYLDNSVIDSAVIGVTDVSGSLDITGDVLSTTGNIDLLLNQSLVIEISTTVNNDTDVGQIIDNSATLQWSSLDGELDGDDDGITDGESDERTGAGANPPNDYADEDNEVTNTRGFLAIEKTADVENATIGQIVTYTLQITVAEGRTEIDLSDTLPSGMAFVANSMGIGSNTDGLDIAGLLPNSLSQSLVVTSDVTVDNDGATAHNSTFTLTYEALVENVAGNQTADDLTPSTVLINSVNVTADLNDDDDVTDSNEDQDTSDNVTVIEPVLEIVKESDDLDDFVAPGQLVTYTLTVSHVPLSTADAFEVVIDDPFPPELENYSLVSAVITDGVNPDQDVSSAFALSAAGVLSTATADDLDLLRDTGGAGVHQQLVITLSGNVIITTPENTNIDNTATLRWSSLDGTLQGDDPGISDGVTDERTGNDGTSPNTYISEDPDRVTVGQGSIGDRVWWDQNSNGVQDANELGLPGITVNLWRDDNGDGIIDTGDLLLRSQITDQNGEYLFEGVPTEFDDGAGNVTEIDYIVEVTPNAGFTATYDLDGIITTDQAALILDDGNENRRDVDFGYVGNGSIGDRIWEDLNRNDLQDAGEPGVNGIPITLRFNSGSGIEGQTFTLQQTTSGDGDYLFTGLIPGSYTIIMDVNAIPEPSFLSFELDGNQDGVVNVNLGPNGSRRDVDFGVQNSSLIAGPVDERTIQPLRHRFRNPRTLITNTTSYDTSLPIVLPPIYSGTAAPGTTLVLVLRDSAGMEVARQTVVSDAGGNYLASFPGSKITLRPVNLEMSITQPVQRAGGNAMGFNPEFGGSFHTSKYWVSSSGWMNQSHATGASLMDSLMELIERPISLGYESHSVELNHSL